MLGAAYSELETLSKEAHVLTERLARKTMDWSVSSRSHMLTSHPQRY